MDSLILPRVTFIKVDVERHEQQALYGALGTIRKWLPNCLVENPSRTVREMFADLGYRAWAASSGALVPDTGQACNVWFIRDRTGHAGAKT